MGRAREQLGEGGEGWEKGVEGQGATWRGRRRVGEGWRGPWRNLEKVAPAEAPPPPPWPCVITTPPRHLLLPRRPPPPPRRRLRAAPARPPCEARPGTEARASSLRPAPAPARRLARSSSTPGLNGNHTPFLRIPIGSCQSAACCGGVGRAPTQASGVAPGAVAGVNPASGAASGPPRRPGCHPYGALAMTCGPRRPGHDAGRRRGSAFGRGTRAGPAGRLPER